MATRTSSTVVGVDLGGTDFKIALVDPNGSIIRQSRRPTLPGRGPAAVLNDVAREIQALRTTDGDGPIQVAALGIATPGPLDLKRGIITRAANLPGWINVPIGSILGDLTSLPVVVENDGNAAAWGEHWVGAGRSHRHLVLLTLGTGVGAGVIIDDRMLHGAFGNAAELGHWIVEPDGRPCNCGQRGCLEQYASASALVRSVQENLRLGRPSALRSNTPDDLPLDARLIAEAAHQGDRLAAEAWHNVCRFLALACVNIQHAFNPSVVLLGGGLSAAGDLLLSGVRDSVDRMTWRLHNDKPAILLAALGNKAGAIGAARLAFAVI